MRFDGSRYIHCRWCAGNGCLYCKKEADKAYKSAFPDGPQPIATIKTDTPEGLAAARDALGPDAINKAFGPDGGGMKEFIQNIDRVLKH